MFLDSKWARYMKKKTLGTIEKYRKTKLDKRNTFIILIQI